MNIIEVNTDCLYTEATATYLLSADRRIVSGFRAALEMLGIAVPYSATRKPAGPRRRIGILRDYHGDNPVEAIADHRAKLDRKLNTNTVHRAVRTKDYA